MRNKNKNKISDLDLNIVKYSKYIHKNTSRFTALNLYQYIIWLEKKNNK